MKCVKVKIVPDGEVVEVEEGANLLDVLRMCGTEFLGACGGFGICGKCRVRILSGRTAPPTCVEKKHLSFEELNSGIRLACQVRLTDSIEVAIDELPVEFPSSTSTIFSGVQSLPHVRKRMPKLSSPSMEDQRSYFERLRESLGSHVTPRSPGILQKLSHKMRKNELKLEAVMYGDQILDLRSANKGRMLGVAVDIGTTTIVIRLWDLEKVLEVANRVVVNPQVKWGSDVITRMAEIMKTRETLSHMQNEVLKSIKNLILDMIDEVGIDVSNIYHMMVAGNTVMMHIFLGVCPDGIATAPYVPAFTESLTFDARDCGLGEILPNGIVTLLPCVSAYVGADVVADLLYVKYVTEELGDFILMDMGTNGEVVVKSGDRMLVSSTAAGPAFEGWGISRGMPGVPGAVDRVWYENGELRFTTVGGAKPRGICGSGLLDLMAEALRLNILDSSGRIRDVDELAPEFRKFVGWCEGEKCIKLADNIYVTQRDVRAFQSAKSAIRSCLEVLKAEVKLSDEDVNILYIVGNFGANISVKNAIYVGLLPSISFRRILNLGSVASMGASLVLLNSQMEEELKKMVEKLEPIELMKRKEFRDLFLEYLKMGEGREKV